MKKNKGFTLIELLGSIIVLGIIIGIALPVISNYIRQGKTKYYNSLEKTIEASARDYLEDYRALLPRGEVGNVTIIYGDELLINNYIDKIVDTDGNPCMAEVAAKKIGTNEFEYHTCLKCKQIEGTEEYEYQSKDEECGYNEDENRYIDSDTYRIEIIEDEKYEIDLNGIYIVAQGTSFDLPNAIVTKDGLELSVKAIPSPSKIDTNKLGIQEVKYLYHGAEAKITVKVVDRTPPSKPEVVLRKGSFDGDIYKNGWSSKDVYHTITSTDYTLPGVNGSGIKRYDISFNGTTWEPLDGNTYITNEDGIYTYYVRTVDNENNVSEVTTYEVRIDKVRPELEIRLTGTIGENDWYISDVKVENIIKDSTSDLFQTGISITGQNSRTLGISISSLSERLQDKGILTTTLTNNTTQDTITSTLTDLAGNGVTATKDVKIDKKKPENPTITATDKKISGSWHNSDVTLELTGSSSTSGITYFYSLTRNELVSQTYNSLIAKANSNTENDKNKVIKSATISHTDNTSSTIYYAIACNAAGTCSDIASYEVKLDETTPSAPTIAISDGIASGKWHKDNFTLSYSGASNISGNTYYYGTTTNPTTSGTSTTISTNTTSTTYYIKVCTGSGICSTTTSYEVKLDTVTPSAPTITASDGIGSNSWHKADFTLSGTGANNISGNTYYYGTTTNPTATSDKITAQTTGTTHYVKVCSGAGRCSDNSSYVAKLDKTAPSAPTIKISDGIASGSWHKANFTLSYSGASNISGNTYYYGTTTSPSTSGTSTTISTNTTSTTYYIKVCTGSGLCSSNSSYVAKLDKTTPSAPTIKASDGIGSGSWHKANFTLSGTGASNISGNTYYYGTTTSPTATSDSITTETSGTTHYVKVCSGAGLCSGNSSYVAKLDKTAPTCTSSGGNGNWVTQLTITGTCYDGLSTCSSNTITKKYTTAISSTTESPGRVSDVAGNTTDCPANQTVKIDPKAPTCTVSTTAGTTAADITITCSAGSSGCTSIKKGTQALSMTNSSAKDSANSVTTVSYTVTAGNGLTGTCSKQISRITQTRTRSCSAWNTCTDYNSCKWYNQVDDTSSCKRWNQVQDTNNCLSYTNSDSCKTYECTKSGQTLEGDRCYYKGNRAPGCSAYGNSGEGKLTVCLDNCTTDQCRDNCTGCEWYDCHLGGTKGDSSHAQQCYLQATCKEYYKTCASYGTKNGDICEEYNKKNGSCGEYNTKTDSSCGCKTYSAYGGWTTTSSCSAGEYTECRTLYN